MPEKNDWAEKFDLLTLSGELRWPEEDSVKSLPENHLLRTYGKKEPAEWPESRYELDPEKVKKFIADLLLSDRREAAEELERVLPQKITSVGELIAAKLEIHTAFEESQKNSGWNSCRERALSLLRSRIG